MSNKDPRFMTSAELRELADQKEQETKIYKTGILKHDLYSVTSIRCLGSDSVEMLRDGRDCATKAEIDKCKKEINRAFEIALKKGTLFVAFLIDGEETWYDDVNYGIEDMTAEWAKEHLENITIAKE